MGNFNFVSTRECVVYVWELVYGNLFSHFIENGGVPYVYLLHFNRITAFVLVLEF